ncbi:hypothetical protein ACEPAH_7367 [Sanghuangporus vaninii]
MVGLKEALHRLNPSHPSSTDDRASFGSSQEKDGKALASYPAPVDEEVATAADPSLNPGALSFEEDAAGGMGRHLGVFSCTMLIVGRIIGTGIFSTPSTILGSVGSVGASLMLWVLGFFLSFSGLLVWLELGTMFPRSGGEKVYLEAVYKRPKGLATVFYAFQIILLGFTASGCIVFANNILITAGVEAGRWNARGIALGVITFVTLVHGFTPKLGLWIMNAISLFKVFLLAFVIVTGWVVLGGKTSVEDPHANFRDAFAGSSPSSGDYATAMFKVINAYAGWSNINYVMNEVKDPVRTLKIAGPLGLGICAVSYIFANIAYFAASTKEEILASKVTVASLFFKKVFGEQAQRALSVFVGIFRPSALFSNVMTVTFSMSRVNQEVAKEGMPLPFGNKFWASNWPTGKSPLPGLMLHFIPSAIVILAPPPDVAYPFILDVEGYPTQILNLLIIFGLFYLRWKKPDAVRPFKVWWPVAFFFMATAVFLIVVPYIRPANGVGDTPPLPYYLYCLVAIGVLAGGVIYWAMWRQVLPRIGKYKLYPAKETLDDGTVVTVYKKRKIQ